MYWGWKFKERKWDSKKKRLFYGDDRKRGNLDKYLTVDALKDKYSINLICAVLKLNRSSYYEWLKAKKNNKYLEVEKNWLL